MLRPPVVVFNLVMMKKSENEKTTNGILPTLKDYAFWGRQKNGWNFPSLLQTTYPEGKIDDLEYLKKNYKIELNKKITPEFYI